VTLNAEAVRDRTITHNLDVKSAELEVDVSNQDYRMALSQYDLYLSGEYSYVKDLSERKSTIFGTNSTTTQYNLGLTQLTPTGTEFTLAFYNTKETSNSAFATSSSLFDSRAYANISQPILNNFFGLQTRGTVKQAKLGRDIALKDSISAIQDVLFANLQSYWQWYLQSRLKEIHYQAQSSATRLYRTNRQKMAIGLIEESEIYAFKANVDLKKSDFLQSQTNLASASTVLRVALDLPQDEIELGKETMTREKLVSADDMIMQAMEDHPEYQALKKSLKVQRIEVAMEKNSRLPQLDLQGSLALNGIDPTHSTAVSDIGNGNPVWTGGVSVSFPLQNRYARASYKKEKLKKTQLLYSLKKLENTIYTQIKEGHYSYKKAWERMNVVSQAVKHQRLKWEGEIKKYDQGRSDPDIVIRYQNDYLDTQKLFAQAQVDFQLAKLKLKYYRGKI